MPVTTVKADQVRGEGRNRYTTSESTQSAHHVNSRNHKKRNNNKKYHAPKPIKHCRATQLTPRFDLVTDVMAVDLEGCQKNGEQFAGSLSVANEYKQGVYDTFVDHGGYRTENEFINALPPKSMGLGVYWKDLAPWNGAHPVKQVIQSFIDLAAGRTIIFHDYGADRRMLDHSAGMCGLTIPWHEIKVRDTQQYRGYWFANTNPHTGPALKDVVAKQLPDLKFRLVEHGSLEDSIATMLLYLLQRDAIEAMYTPVASHAAVKSEAESGDSRSNSMSSAGEPQTPHAEGSICAAVEGITIDDPLDSVNVETQGAFEPSQTTNQVKNAYTVPFPTINKIGGKTWAQSAAAAKPAAK
ncbi:hypothetical protein LTS10_004608 [Elasticomyces elasticus]|nr:hypothetical protein LTS10_004608 [Elasticomyces elasticus]